MTVDSKTFEYAKQCGQCEVKFGLRKYRYHCRLCLKSFCHSHCNIFRTIPNDECKKNVRVCVSCDLKLSSFSPSEKQVTTPRSDDGVVDKPIMDSPEEATFHSDTSSSSGSPRASITSDELPSSRLSKQYSSSSSNSIEATNATPLMPYTLNMITYNVWMMPDRVTAFARSVSPNKQERAVRIAMSIPRNTDVVVFQEAFCDRSRLQLLEAMAQRGFIYRSPVVGRVESGIRPLDGGVVLCSKHPIVVAETKKFGSCCTGDDRMADKGVLYVKLLKDDTHPVHIFGTHTQAWNYKKAVRVRHAQFRHLRRFIHDKKIPGTEAVIVTGDLNVDRWNPCPTEDSSGANEYERMLQTLQCREATYTTLEENKFSFDSTSNLLAAPGLSSDGSCELLDYVLYSRYHRQPVSAQTFVQPLKSSAAWKHGAKRMVKDLSDHYPVVAKYKF